MATRDEMIMAVKAVQNGFINQQQVQTALDIQRQMAEKGKVIPLLTIFTKKNFLDPHQVQFITTGQGVALDPKDPKQRRSVPGYKLLEKIGQGGMASVYTAESEALDGEVVALKILFPHHYKNAKFIEGFLNEAKMLSELDHPNLVRGFDFGQGGDLYYMAIEYVDGQSVQQMLDERGKLEESLALSVVLQVARALHYLGSQGITHRDIKPDNMLFDDRGELKLIDLGFAKSASSAEEEGVTCGTVQYISPEQARGRSDVDIRSDIYSLGATLYHLVIGEVPFSGSDSMDVMAKQVLEELSSDKTKSGAISQQMQYFLEKMMAKEREIRYQSPAEVIEDIETVVQGNRALQFRPEQAGMGGGFELDVGGKPGSGRRRGSGPLKSARAGESSRRAGAETSGRRALRRPGESTRAGEPKRDPAKRTTSGSSMLDRLKKRRGW